MISENSLMEILVHFTIHIDTILRYVSETISQNYNDSCNVNVVELLEQVIFEKFLRKNELIWLLYAYSKA